MSNNIGQFNEEIIKGQIKELVRGSVEEALIEMYLAGVSVRRVEDITEALWGQQAVRLHHQRAEQESLCQHRDLAQPPLARRQVPLCVCGRYLPQAELGR